MIKSQYTLTLITYSIKIGMYGVYRRCFQSKTGKLGRKQRKSFLRALRVYDELEAAGDEIRAREAECIINSLCKDVWDIGRSEVSKNVWDATFLFRLRNCEPTYC